MLKGCWTTLSVNEMQRRDVRERGHYSFFYYEFETFLLPLLCSDVHHRCSPLPPYYHDQYHHSSQIIGKSPHNETEDEVSNTHLVPHNTRIESNVSLIRSHNIYLPVLATGLSQYIPTQCTNMSIITNNTSHVPLLFQHIPSFFVFVSNLYTLRKKTETQRER